MEFRGWGGAALITGASSGIGLALARQLANRGMHVLLVSRATENLRVLAQRLSSEYKVRAIAIPGDLSTVEGPGNLVKTLSQVELEIDLLVNNAGFGIYGPFANQGPERESEMIRLNVGAPTELAARLLPGMIRRRRGLILNVASTAGFAPVPWIGTYAATKGYVIQWTIALDEEIKGTGVRAAVLCPGTTATNFHQVSGAAKGRKKDLPQQTAAAVAMECLKGLDRGKRVIVTGLLNKLHVAAASTLPAGLAANVAVKVMRPKKKTR
jgi:short-subunit dehydrogenase